MKICCYGKNEGEITGCFWIRLREPLKELIKQGHEVIFTDGYTPIPWEGWDIIIFNNLMGGVVLMQDGKEVGEITLKEVIEKFKKGGAKIVYDCDDGMDLIPDFMPKEKCYDECAPSFKIMIENADLITVTTETLKKYIEKYTKVPIKVLPNSIDPSEFGERGKEDRVKIIFAGSGSHVKDVEISYPAIERLKRKHKIYYEQIGFQHKGCKYRKPVPVVQWYGAIASMNADIGICPLEDTEFNQCKSPLKFLEYSQLDMAVLASNVLPYKGVMKREWLCNDDEWEEKLEKLITDKDYREKIAKEQNKFVLKNYDIRKNYKMWEEAYEELCPNALTIINSPNLKIEPLKENSGKLLKDIAKRLKKQKYWISAGTALGLYRDKDFIKGDTDLDFAMLGYEGIEKDITKIMKDAELVRATFTRVPMQMAFMKDGTIIDFYFHWRNGENIENKGESGWTRMRADICLKPQKIETKYGKLPIPQEAYFEIRYGSTWCVPSDSKPYFYPV